MRPLHPRSLLLTLSISFLFSGLQTQAAIVPWSIDFDASAKRVGITLQDKRYSLLPPKTISKTASDDNTLYLWNAGSKQLSLLSKYELATIAPGNSLNMVPFGTISFSEELGKVQVLDFTAAQNGGNATLLFSSPGSKTGSVKIYPYAFLKAREIDEEAFFAGTGKKTSNEDLGLEKRTRTGLMAFKGGPKEILGTGSITLLPDPENGGMLLLSYDAQNLLIHEYGATNPYELLYLRSYPLPESLKKDASAMKQFTLDAVGAPQAYFFLRHPQYESVRLSILKLREAQAIKRAYVLNNWNNEVAGNLWTKQLLAWGALSSVIDSLDRAYSNPNVNLSLVSKDPSVQAVLANVKRDEVLSFAKDSGLFTAKEMEEMRLEGDLKEGRGRKSALTAGLVVGILGYINVKDGNILRNQAYQLGSNVWAFCERILILTGRTPEQIQNFRSWGARMQIKFRAHLVKSAEMQRHPSHLIRSLEKQLKKARTELAQTGSQSFAIKIDPAKAPDAKVRQILEQWKNVLEANPAIKSAELKKAETAIAKDVEKLKTLEAQIKVNDQLTRLKTQILITKSEAEAITAGTRIPTIRELSASEQNMAFLKATDPNFIAQNAEEAIKALDMIEMNLKKLAAASPKDAKLASQAKHFSEVLKPTRAAMFTKNVKDLLSETKRLNDIVGSWSTQGKVHPFFDHWAKVSALWAQYFLPQQARNAIGLESEMARKWFRQDHVRLADGTTERVVITGEHAKLALTTGIFDVSGDVITQWIARSNTEDPNERIWGTGDNHLGIVPWNGHRYGPHFDLIASELTNAWGWALSMPMSYARMDMSFGSKSSISILRRLWDSQLKSLPNMPYAMANEYPFWFLGNKLVSWDYQVKHEAAGDFNQADFEKFRERLGERTTSFTSQLERFMFNKAVGVPYITPQYNLQSEFNKVSDLIFRTPWVKQIVSGIVMPVSTGFGYGKWWGDYFGFNHPATIEVMKELGIEGILQKIDDQGYTNINAWTEHEQTMFYFMISLFEFERHGKEVPLPEGQDEAKLAAWYKDVYRNLFASEEPDLNVLNKNLTKVRVIPAASVKKTSSDKDVRYAEEAKKLLAMMKNMRSGMAKLPFAEANRNNDTFAVQVESGVTKNASVEQLDTMLQDAIHLNASLADTFRVMNANRGVFTQLQGNSYYLNLASTLALGDQFFAQGRLIGFPVKLVNQWNATTQRILSRMTVGGMVASLPYYLWLDDQAEAHLRNATADGLLIRDLESLLFSATELLTIRYTEESMRGNNAFEKLQPQLTDLRVQMEKQKWELEQLLTNTQADSQDLLSSRRYRWAKVYSQYSLFGMGLGGGWYAVRNTLFKASTGMVMKMTDPFAPLLFKASALAWLYYGQEYGAQKDRIALTTQDFFVLHQSYASTCLRLELLKMAEQAIANHQTLPSNAGELLQKALESNTVYKQTAQYRTTLEKLVNE